jgi:hypothetical protein
MWSTLSLPEVAAVGVMAARAVAQVVYLRVLLVLPLVLPLP